MVVINKVDRPDSRIDEVVDEVYELFFDLDAADDHIEFPIISLVAREGRSDGRTRHARRRRRLSPLLDAIVETIPARPAIPTHHSRPS